MIRMPRAYRRHTLWMAALIHRLSGLALAVFLPIHFLALGLATGDGVRFEAFLRWADAPLVKAAEGGLIFLLVVHLFGGLRLLLVENFSWRANQTRFALIAAALAAIIAFAFLARTL